MTALEELEKTVEKPKAPEEKKTEKTDTPPVVDKEEAEKRYTKGLVAYAHGRIRDAIRIWELTLRLDPGHKRAKKAKETAEAELKKE